ncbi:Transcription factor [Tieghemiomyces parasiticus]|uniref:Transcription factor n=1 Tax=Tieghemiomyces parasiticus TaxID=78921 RepID=A0A9W7ZS19_9FUNG|nr:Transcription factor [Tieghemiomyces parasiticus]
MQARDDTGDPRERRPLGVGRNKRKKVNKAHISHDTAPPSAPPSANASSQSPNPMHNYLQALMGFPLTGLTFASQQVGDEYSVFSNILQNLDGNSTVCPTGSNAGPLPNFNAPGGPYPPAMPYPNANNGNTATAATPVSLQSHAPPSAAMSVGLISTAPAVPLPPSSILSSRPIIANGTGPTFSAPQPTIVPPAGSYPTNATEKFFHIAADPSDTTSEGRLRQVINAKYEAGMLTPYNYVKGYSRLQSYMEKSMSPLGQARILSVLSFFRPTFRNIAQSLKDFDLVVVEEMFERYLLEYDRMFSAIGIPACLWRRTGEIYKANKEFANLIKVPLSELKEGRLSIYELMMEESAVNYWEKYGNIAFDASQKAVLTSCILQQPADLNDGLVNSDCGGNSSFPPPQASPATATTTPTAGGQSYRQSPVANGCQPHHTYGSNASTPHTGTLQPSPSLTIPRTPPPQSAGGGNRSGSRHFQPIPCCFSFTIRRDKYNIPLVIVGNFLPVRPM